MISSAKNTVAYVLLALSLLLFCQGCEKEVDAGPVAPEFNLVDLSGDMVSLTDYRGKVVLLDFWATWCMPCRMSIPELNKIQQRYESDGLVVLGVSLDNPQQLSRSDMETFKRQHKIQYKILRYTQGMMQDYFGEATPSIPTMFVINREGRIKDKIVGFNPKALETALNEVIEH
jgi:peroxiredoxin